MEKVIKLYNYVDGVNDTPFPSKEEQIEIFTFEYNANRMGGAPLITARAMHRLCLDNLWNDKVYALFNGERFFVMNTPSSSKNNTDERYEHEIQMLSEREILNHVYFIDAVRSGADTQVSNSPKFQFVGNIKQFVERLNSSLAVSGVGYSAVVDSGMTSEDKNISFDKKYIMEALQEAFTAYEIPYYFRGRVIHFGLAEETVGEPLKYGHKNALMSISKSNANYKVINRISGAGSEDNIPYYYPNDSDNRAEIEAAGGKWITPSQNLMPSIYRESLGKERFYNALNGTYPTPEGGYYDFNNPYTEGNPKESFVDFPEIKPTIKGGTNAAGKRIDMFSEFAYDKDDSEEMDEQGNYLHPYFFGKLRKTDGTQGFNLFAQANEKEAMVVSMTSGVCAACKFQIGVGQSTDKNTVQVDESGNLLRDEKGDVRCGREGKPKEVPQDKQNNTQTNEVWVALKKDTETFTAFGMMPNAQRNLRPSTSDTFVLLGITLPKAYILAAEKRLDDSLIKYMWMNNDEKFNFSVKFSRIYFTEHPEVLDYLNENSRILLEYDGNSYPLYIDEFSYKMDGSDSLPEIEVNLTETLTVGKNSLQTALDSVKRDILSSMGGGDFLKQGLKYFLRKDIADAARGLIKFLNGAEFGNFIKGRSGVGIDTLGNIIAHKIESHGFSNGALGTGFQLKNDPNTNKSYLEVDNLFVRVKAFFTELEIKKLSYAGGNWIFSPAGATCSQVEDKGGYFRCYFVAENKDQAVKNEFRVNDQVKCQEFNVKEDTSHNVSNRYYWRLCVGVGNDYIDLSKTDYDKSVPNNAPQIGDAMVTLGNRTDVSRQNAIVISAYGEGSPSITQHSGINTYSLKDTEKTRISPTKNKFTGEFIFESGKSVQELIDERYKENKGFIEAINVDVDEIKRQVDKSITSWFYDAVPTLNNLPASEWTTDELKNTHLGDLYYDKNGKSYRFQLEKGVYSWVIITDTDITKALADASKAQDTADNKRRVFVDTPVTPYDKGDLWMNATYADTSVNYDNDILRCKTSKTDKETFSIGDWEKASKYTDDTATENLKKDVEVKFQATDENIEGVVKSVNKVNDSVTNLSTRVAQTESDITSQAKKITSTANTVNSHTTRINQNAEAIKSKASQSSVNSLTGRVEKAETEITQTANSISAKVKEEVGKIKVGGRNLIANSSLITIGKETSVYNNIKLKPTVHFKPDTSYALSVGGIMITDGSQVSSIEVNVFNNDDYSVYWNGKLEVKDGLQTVIFTTPRNVNMKSEVLLRIYSGISGSANNREVQLRYMMLEEGTMATNWSPAPEDLENVNDNLVLDSAALFEKNNSSKTYTMVKKWKELEGKDISLSFDYDYWGLSLGSSGYQRIGLEVSIPTSDGTKSLSCWVDFKVVGTNSNVGRASSTMVVPKNISDVGLNTITAYIQLQGGGSGYIDIKNIKVEEGNNATAWKPALEDSFPSNEQLLATGIDINSKEIKLTAKRTWFVSSTGKNIASFSEDADGGIRFDQNVYCTYVKATKGTIGGFTISNSSIGSENAGDSLLLTTEGIMFNNSRKIAGIGDTIPAVGSPELMAAKFSTTLKPDDIQEGLGTVSISSSGGTRQVALKIRTDARGGQNAGPFDKLDVAIDFLGNINTHGSKIGSSYKDLGYTGGVGIQHCWDPSQRKFRTCDLYFVAGILTNKIYHD